MTKKLFGSLSLLIVLGTGVIFFFAPHLLKVKGDSSVVGGTGAQTETVTSQAKETEAAIDPNLPKVARTDWDLVLVNWEHSIGEQEPDLESMKNGYLIDKRVYSYYYALAEDAAAAGYDFTVISAYRSVKSQEEIFEQTYQEHLAEGLSEADAKEKTKEYITAPGTSEHHTGLALDVVDTDWYNKDKGLEKEFGQTDAGKWLAKNASNYGFVIRYLAGKEKLTNINYEPWHLRYVGKENALYMQQHNLVLEEYLELLKEAGQ